MFAIIGIVVVLGSLVAGYTMHGGQLLVLWQISEFIIIGGAAIGAFIVANPMTIIQATIKKALGTLKGSPASKKSYLELLQMMYELFMFSKREGVIAIEPHIEKPKESSILSKYPTFLANHHAVDFFCDTMKIILSGGLPVHDLEELMDIDLETQHHQEAKPAEALNTMSDAFPGLGIVAAVLGVVITMGKIDQPPAIIGQSVGAALVGTFIGILLCYGVVGPLVKNMENISHDEHQYMMCIKASLLSFVKGAPPLVAVEFGRRAISLYFRPTYEETEQAVKK